MTKLLDKSCTYTEWRTPPHILNAVRQYFARLNAGVIDLDPATSIDNPTEAASFITEEENGLVQPWKGNVFINPPYGKVLRQWAAKIGSEARVGARIVALLPGQRFETSYWQEHILTSELHIIVFLRRRLQFLRTDGTVAGSNPYGSMLYLYNVGSNKAPALEAFGPFGKVVSVQC